MKFFLIVIAVFVLYLFFFLCGKYDEKRKEKIFRYRLLKEYGTLIDKEYSNERMLSLKGYFNKHINEDRLVDDITWNDIDGQRLFQRINYCNSSVGEEYLYFRLRNLCFGATKEEIERMEERFSSIDSNEKERVGLQLLFGKLGRCGKYSIFQYIDWLETVKKKPVLLYWLFLLIYPACFVLISLMTPVGVLILCIFLTIRILLHVTERKEIEPYIVSLAYLIRTFKFVDSISKNKFLRETWPEETKRLIELRKHIKGINTFHMMFLHNSGESLWDGIMIYVNSFTGFDMIAFYSMLDSVSKYKTEMDEMISLLGKIESEISIASFRHSLSTYCVPEFTKKNGMIIKDAVHPLLDDPVANSFEIERGMLLTGSNASGKSTFLKTVEIAAILAQTIQTVPAKYYQAPEYKIYSSMALRDDLESNESYYIVEIKAIKRILDSKKNCVYPVLCFVDEVLRGTNTVERISAASEILRELSGDGILSFAATHDVELTGILAEIYDNYHFEELVTNDDVSFPYKLLKGPARTRNAIKLLKLMGYPEQIIVNAEKRALSLLAEKVDLNE